MKIYRDSKCFAVLIVGVIFSFILLSTSAKLHAQQAASNVGTIGISYVPDYSAGDAPRSLIRAVLPNGPAYLAGLRPGDIIIRIDGAEVTARTMGPTLQKKAVGSDITITYVRNGVSHSVIVTLADRFPLYEKLAQTGEPFAECGLAYSYLEGLGVPKDQSEGLKWLRKAADGGAENCQYALGLAYAKGNGVDKDQAEALKWWRKAAEQGFPEAEANLGWAYTNGAGVQKDETEGVKWYRKAAELGLAQAKNGLGLAYETGTGVKKDLAEAVKWYRKAAEQGDARAEYNLGRAYINGIGVHKDQAEATKWFKKAEEQDFEDFRSNVSSWRALATKPELPEEVRKHKVLAENALQEKDIDKALSEYKVGLEMYPPWPEGQFNAALLCEEKKLYEWAIHYMKRYLELAPDAPDARAARDKITIWEDKARLPGIWR